jgi:transcriptional regulator
MYLPKAFEENRVEVLHALIRQYPFGALITLNDDGLQANHIPFEIESAPEPFGTLYAHVARANPVWRDLSRNHDALVIFQGPQSYVSPSWYVSKRETGMVVPTWNYVVVHARGRLEPIDDPAWLRAFVEKLTKTHEQVQTEPWNISDAPAQYIENQLTAIIGLKLTITGLIGKWKLNQNRSARDRASVIQALVERGTESSLSMAQAMEKTNNDAS